MIKYCLFHDDYGFLIGLNSGCVCSWSGKKYIDFHNDIIIYCFDSMDELYCLCERYMSNKTKILLIDVDILPNCTKSTTRIKIDKAFEFYYAEQNFIKCNEVFMFKKEIHGRDRT